MTAVAVNGGMLLNFDSVAQEMAMANSTQTHNVTVLETITVPKSFCQNFEVGAASKNTATTPAFHAHYSRSERYGVYVIGPLQLA